MEPLSLKPKGPTKLIPIDEYTWIETSVNIPDDVARQKFLKKWKSNLTASIWKPGQQVQQR